MYSYNNINSILPPVNEWRDILCAIPKNTFEISHIFNLSILSNIRFLYDVKNLGALVDKSSYAFLKRLSGTKSKISLN